MARNIKCPWCGTVGAIAPYDEIVFQGRGQFDGKTIVKCMKCGNGLTFGLFSGIFFGKPNLILPEVWQRMEKMWREEFGKN